MKASKYFISAFLFFTVWSNAQTVDQNVTVEREYKPVIQDAGKISSVPEVMDPNAEKIAAKYTEFNLPLPVSQNIHTLSAAELGHQQRKNPNDAFIRMGIGNYFNNAVDFALPVIKKTDLRLDLKLNHMATFSQETHSSTNASLVLDKYFKKANLYSGIGLGHEYFNYYGNEYNKTGAITDLSTLALSEGNNEYLEQNLVRINRTAKDFKLSEITKSENDVFWRFNTHLGVSAEWKAVPKWLDFYAGIGGGYNVNTLDEMFSENRFLHSDLRVKDTYTPVSAYFGIKVKPVYNLLLDAYVNYRYIDNQYFFINKDYSAIAGTVLSDSNDSIIYSNRFNVIYSAASLVKVGIRANYNIRNLLNIQLKGAYNGWTVYDTDMAWNKPKFEADLTADWRLNRNLTFTGNMFFESERYAKLGDLIMTMNPKFDVNVGASYSYLNWLTVFAKVNNILNNRYENFYGYKVQGLNILAGAAISF